MEIRPRSRARVLLAAIAALCLTALAAWPRPASGQEGPVAAQAARGGADLQGPFAQGQVGAAFLTNVAAGDPSVEMGWYALRAGWRWTDWDVFGVVGHHLWFDNASAIAPDPTPGGVLNVGVGMGLRYFDDRVRSSVSAGTSTMLFDTALLSSGDTGVFAEVQPIGIRWRLGDDWALEAHPLMFVFSAPGLTGIPLFKASYASNLTIETTF